MTKMITVCPTCGREVSLLGDATHIMTWEACGPECQSLAITCSATRLSRFRQWLQRVWPW